MPINHLDLTLPTPAANLALDEALLDSAEAGYCGEVLRFWESGVPFVVLGYSNPAATEVDLPACAAAGVPVLRRASGGGTVVQGPGCLNYTLILRGDEPPLHTIPGTNRFIMERNRAALQGELSGKVAVQGHTDLTLDGRKFSGNAQRRKRRFILFHGTVLLNFDLSLIGRLLRMPTHQPTYRQGRGHHEFICNVPLAVSAIRQVLSQAWGAERPVEVSAVPDVETLVTEKYSQPDWNLKF